MDAAAVAAWVDNYVRAWNSNDPVDIGGLFTDDAVYFTGPFDQAWQGRDTIVREWLARQDEPGTTTFRYEVLATGPDVGIVRGWTQYHVEPPSEFSNMWLIRFGADGRCREFTEWWVEKDS
jgi:uncharacterized protein (TIGR02246 family)